MSERDELFTDSAESDPTASLAVLLAESGKTTMYDLARVAIEAGYRKPRTITTAEELDALPDGSLIKFPSGLGRTQRHSISALTGGEVITDKRLALPATVLYTPEPSS